MFIILVACFKIAEEAAIGMFHAIAYSSVEFFADKVAEARGLCVEYGGSTTAISNELPAWSLWRAQNLSAVLAETIVFPR